MMERNGLNPRPVPVRRPAICEPSARRSLAYFELPLCTSGVPLLTAEITAS